MTKKIVHEIRIPTVVTIALYCIALGLLGNLIKPFVEVNPAFAELNYGDRLEVTIKNWPRRVSVQGEIGTYEAF